MIPGRWFKARRSESALGCVEVRVDDRVFRVRDTKDQGRGPVLTFTDAEWHAVRTALLAGPTDLDRLVDVSGSSNTGAGLRAPVDGVVAPRASASPADRDGVQLVLHSDGRLTMRRLADGARLRFTPFEVECFLDGLRGGEFDLPAAARTA